MQATCSIDRAEQDRDRDVGHGRHVFHGKDSAAMTHGKRLLRIRCWTLVGAVAIAIGTGPLAAQQVELDAGIAPTEKLPLRKPARPKSAAGAPAAGRAAEGANIRQVAGAPSDDPAERARQAAANFKMPKEIEALLPEWEQNSKDIKYLEGKFILTQYDEIYQTETKANGQFWYQSPDQGRMDFNFSTPIDLSKFPKDPKSGAPINPKKLGPNGAPYVVKSHAKERWVCTGEKILQILDDDKQFHEVEIQAQYRGESIKNSPLPFLFGLSAAEAKTRYLMNLGSMHRKTVGGCDVPVYHIVALPLRAEDASEWSRAEVLLRSDTFLPYSIRTNDPAGTSTNVYTFSGLDTNKGFKLRDPFSVSTRGYTQMKLEEASPPTSDKTPVKPVNGAASSAAGKGTKKSALK
jgi:hypothetical protein